jgi:hypothetical protein
MSMENLGRRLAWHGVLLFFLSLVEGMFVYSMRNPRMGLTTHVGGITTALFFLAIAALWGPGAPRRARDLRSVVDDRRRRIWKRRLAATRGAPRYQQRNADRGGRFFRAGVAGSRSSPRR